MVRIRPIDRAREKFRARVTVARPDYEFGIRNPRTRWDEAYEAAWERIKEGIMEALAKALFLGGVKRKGHGFWADRVSRKGPGRWADETPKAADVWFTGFKPFADVLAALMIGAKRRKGDPANIDNRVKPIVQALRSKKEELRGAAAS
jgi:hypothetical protein